MTAEPRCKQIGSRLSNWGRWGEDDSLGTMNFITAETRRAAASLVRTGALFDLGIPLDRQGPQRASGMLNSARFNPIHRMTQLPTEEKWPEGEVESDDIVILPLQCATQWDGLAHIGYDKQLYNGVPTSAVTAAAGAERNSFHSLAAREFLKAGIHVSRQGRPEHCDLHAGSRVGNKWSLFFKKPPAL